MRAFLAVELDPLLRDQVAALQRQLKTQLEPFSGRIRVTWVRPDAIHLTVAFLGDIDDALASGLCDAVQPAVRPCSPLTIPLSRVGAFPRAQAPGVLWLGSPLNWEQHDEAKRAGQMVRSIGSACASVGVVPEARPWRAHLTLARVRDGEREVGRALIATGIMDRQADVGQLQVNEIVMMRSQLQQGGPVYSKLWTVTLGAG